VNVKFVGGGGFLGECGCALRLKSLLTTLLSAAGVRGPDESFVVYGA